jgi:hypothetical protein
MSDWSDYIETDDGFYCLRSVFSTLKRLGVIDNYFFDYWEGHTLDEVGSISYYADVMVDMEIWIKDEYWAQSRHRGYRP